MAFLNDTNTNKNKCQSAKKIKSILLKHYRYKGRMWGVLTEMDIHGNIEDVVCFNDKELVSIEVKISKQDFINDFRTKLKYVEGNKFFNDITKFYYCVPLQMVDFVVEYLKNNDDKNFEIYKNIGVMYVSGEQVFVKKKAKKFNNAFDFYNSFHSRYLVMRMGSEIATLRGKEVS